MENKPAFTRRIRREDVTHIIRSDDSRVTNALSLSTRGLAVKLTERDEQAFIGIRFLQEEFQRKYCPDCRHYNPKTKTFIELSGDSYPRNPSDCKWHYTDIIGQCWNYRERQEYWWNAWGFDFEV